MHFILDCNLYEADRIIFFKNVLTINPNFNNLKPLEKFVFLFKSPNASVLTWLGKFIHTSFETRNNMLKAMSEHVPVAGSRRHKTYRRNK